MLALSVRQPFAELILRGIKTVEYRSRPTRIIGERFYLYASKSRQPTAKARQAKQGSLVVSDNLSVAAPPPWMLELAKAMTLFGPEFAELPTGVIVGTAVIEKVTPPDTAFGNDGLFHWHLDDVRRISTPRRPGRHPQPVWWRAE